MARINLSAPWVEYYHKVNELFRRDPDIHVVYDEGDQHLKLYVDDQRKAVALAKFLPDRKRFGNVSLKIGIFPSNGEFDTELLSEADPMILIQNLFNGNSVVSYIHKATGMFGLNALYVVFINRVVQYFSDDLSDINGLHSTLYQDIAKDILNVDAGIYFNTDVPEYMVTTSIGVTEDRSGHRRLGEWP